VAFDAGATRTRSTPAIAELAMTYDPQHNDRVGNATSTERHAGSSCRLRPSVAITYNPANGFFYVATVYPTAVMRTTRAATRRCFPARLPSVR